MSNINLFREIQARIAEDYPGIAAVEILIRLSNGQKLVLPIPLVVLTQPIVIAKFIPTDVQVAVLAMLEGKAMKVVAIGNKLEADGVGAARRFYDDPGGKAELESQGLLAYHKRLGYYRPDSPPPELADSTE